MADAALHPFVAPMGALPSSLHVLMARGSNALLVTLRRPIDTRPRGAEQRCVLLWRHFLFLHVADYRRILSWCETGLTALQLCPHARSRHGLLRPQTDPTALSLGEGGEESQESLLHGSRGSCTVRLNWSATPRSMSSRTMRNVSSMPVSSTGEIDSSPRGGSGR